MPLVSTKSRTGREGVVLFTGAVLIEQRLSSSPWAKLKKQAIHLNDFPREYSEIGNCFCQSLAEPLWADEGEREAPFEMYPWDGVSGVRPFHELASATTVGVY